MVNNKLAFVYVYDALCGWCYGFSPVMTKLYERYKNQFNFEVLSGGMILGDRVKPIGASADLIQIHIPRIEETAGVTFGQPYLDILKEGTQVQNSEKPSIALAVFKSYHPEQAVLFAADLQKAKYLNGADFEQDEIYVPIAEKFGIRGSEFIAKLHDEKFKQDAYYDFALSKQLQVTGYPAAFIKTGDLNFYMVAKGYADYDTMVLRVENVLKQVSA
ncbi:DsbA family protein [Pelobium manganitolerans]|uniref:DsbA family protein n=1 Tax=Pelobium manganitolerans TaxID=1842495 RepID=UPI003FA35E6B